MLTQVMPRFIEILPLSTEIPLHEEYVLMDNGRTDGRTDGRPENIMLSFTILLGDIKITAKS